MNDGTPPEETDPEETSGKATAAAASGRTPPSLGDKRKKLQVMRRQEARLLREIVCEEKPEVRTAVEDLEKLMDVVIDLDTKVKTGLTTTQQKRKESLQRRHDAAVVLRDKQQAKITDFATRLAEYGGEGHEEAMVARRAEALSEFGTLLMEHTDTFVAINLELDELLPEATEFVDEFIASEESEDEGAADTVDPTEED